MFEQARSSIGLASRHHHGAMLEACLNGTRGRAQHPRCPITPAELAIEGAAAVRAGAGALHVHPRRDDGGETLDAGFVAAALEAMRAVTSVPIGVTTGAWFLPDLRDRLHAVERWVTPPDFASVNFHEQGAVDVAAALLERGIAVEAGVWTPDAADLFVRSGLADRCLRVLLEPMNQAFDKAMATLRAIENRLDSAAAATPRLLHGFETTAWPLLELAAARGYDARIGLEDTLMGPDGGAARDNAELVLMARERLGWAEEW